MSDYRDKGNQHFKLKQYEDSLRYYSQAIEFDSKDYLSYTNRSIVFFILGNYIESLSDAENAVRINNQWFKAYFRKSLALKQLGKYRDAIDSLDNALSLIENNNNCNINSSDTKTLLNQFNQEHKDLYNTLIESRYDKITKDMNVEVKFINRYKGKGVISKSNYQLNQELFQESPLVSHISYEYLNNYLFRYCSHCLSTKLDIKLFKNDNQLYNSVYPNEREFIKCKNDECNEIYCSTECMNNATSQYHKVLCGSSSSVNLQQNIKNLYSKCIEHKQTNPLVILRIYGNIIQSKAINNKSIHDSLLPFNSFVSNGEWKSYNDTQMLIILKDIFQPYILNDLEIDKLFTINKYREFNSIIQCNASKVHPPSDIHLFINELAAKAPLTVDHIVVSGKKVTFDQLPEFIEQFDNCCISGSGLFTITNSCNHNCDPSAAVTYSSNSNRVTMRSLKNISKSDEIEISYIDEDNSCSKRRDELQKKYLFKCQCYKCLCEQ